MLGNTYFRVNVLLRPFNDHGRSDVPELRTDSVRVRKTTSDYRLRYWTQNVLFGMTIPTDM